MSKELIDFTYGGPTTGDDGERGDGSTGMAAIKPYADGNPATAASFNRPPENLRHRSEVLRVGLEDQRYLQDSDMHWIISAGLADGSAIAAPIPTITAFNTVTGTFAISDPIVIQPLNTSDSDKKEVVTYGFPTGVGAGEITVTSLRYAFELGNQLQIVFVPTAPASIVAGVPGKCDLTVTGTNGHVLSFQFASDDTADVDDFATLFALPAYIALTNAAGFSCSTAGVGATLVSVADFDPPGSLPFEYEMSGNFDRELHRITAAVINAFFAVPANAMADGDTLAIFFNDLVDPLGGNTGRRERVPGTGTTDVTAGELFITSHTPEWIPGAIPLCKRIGNSLLWLDGTLCTATIPGAAVCPLTFGENGNTVQRILDYATSLANPLAPGGASLIGVATTAVMGTSIGTYNVPAPGDTLDNVILAMLILLDSKASLDLGTFAAPEQVGGVWSFGGNIKLGGSRAAYRASPLMASTDYTLVYRNDGRATTTNTDVGWNTYSVYEAIDATGLATNGSHIFEVWGGSLNAAGTLVTAAAGGFGSVRIAMRGSFAAASGTFELTAEAMNVAGGAVLDPLVGPSWDYHSYRSGNPGAYISHISGLATSQQAWTIPQLVRDEINFQEGTSSIQIASLPWTAVIEGLWAQPENVLMTVWTPDTLTISPGRALVNGKPYSLTSKLTLNNMHTRMMYNVAGGAAETLPVNDAVADTYCDAAGDLPGGIPAWYYLYLRSDGNFFIGKLPPVSGSAATACPGTTLYRPPVNEVHPTYSPADYVLVDVVVLWQVTGGNYYFDCAPNMGGDLHGFINRLLPSSGVNHITPQLEHQTGAAGGTLLTYQNHTGGPLGAECRSPGIPLGVTRNAVITYVYDGVLTAGKEFDFTIFRTNETDFYPNSTHFLVPNYRKKAVFPASDYTFREEGYCDVILSNNGYLARTLTTNNATPNDWYMYLVGFHWDRAAGVQKGMTGG